MYENLKERLTDMSVLASTRTPADALQYIEELEAKLSESEALLAKAVEALSAIEGWTNNTAIEEFARITIAAVAEPHKLTSSEAANGEAKGGKDD